jgi:Uma2 family endonuclease
MSAIPKPTVTPQEYLAEERKADFKSEYYRGEVFAMAGATFEHSLIKDNFSGETRDQLKAGRCRVVTSDMRVQVSMTGLYTYPDIVVVCDEPAFEDNCFDTLLNPQVLIEILSDSTEGYDRGAKFHHYRKIPTLREYVVVSQNRPLVERYVRQSEDRNWLLTPFEGLDRTFEFASIAARVALSEIYRGVAFPENAGR